MSTVASDTYAQVKQLVQTGVPEAQAEAFVNVVAGVTVLPDVSQLATKADLTILQSDISVLKSDVAALKSDVAVLKSDVASLKRDVALVESNLRGEIKGLKGDLIWWILGAVGFTAVFPQLLAHLPK